MKIKKIKPLHAGLIALAVILIGFLVWGGIYCAVNDETPSDMIHDIVTPNEDQLIGKWQGEKAINGYEFYEDGSYDNYLLGFATTKYYDLDGNKLILRSNTDNRRVVYKYRVNGDKLTLTLIESEGKKVDDDEKQVFTRVKHFNFKSATEAIQDFAKELTTEEASEDAQN